MTVRCFSSRNSRVFASFRIFALKNGPCLSFSTDNFCPKSQAVVPVSDRGFLLGDGLFETMRVAGGRPFRFAQHLERLARGADFLKIKLPFTPNELKNFAGQLIEQNKMREAILRLTVTRGPGGRGYAPNARQTDGCDDVASLAASGKSAPDGTWSPRHFGFPPAIRWPRSRRRAKFCTSWRAPKPRNGARTRRCSSTRTAKWPRPPAAICSGFTTTPFAPCQRNAACCRASRGRSFWKSARRSVCKRERALSNPPC